MEVAILQPYDCLKRQNHHHHQSRSLISGPTKPRRNNLNLTPNPNPNPNPNPTHNHNHNPRSNRRRRNSPPPPQPNKAQQTRPKSPPSLGQVRILKRGEQISLPSPPSPTPPPAPSESTGRGLPGPMIDGFYAGSAFVTSPAPSEVPLPAFFTRRNCGLVSGGDAHNQEIASELRRVLKLC